MITISDTLQTTLSNFACYLNTIYQEITEADMSGQSNFMVDKSLFLSTDNKRMFSF